MINNGGQLNAYKDHWYDENFKNFQLEGMKEVISKMFDKTPSCSSQEKFSSPHKS